jgi:hypothetical protein
MIVSPNKGVFFVATALMCSVSLYGAELSSPRNDPLTRVFVGEPNRLSLPPGFLEPSELQPDESRIAEDAQPVPGRGAVISASAVSETEGCGRETKAGLGSACPVDATPAANADRETSNPAASAGASVRAH